MEMRLAYSIDTLQLMYVVAEYKCLRWKAKGSERSESSLTDLKYKNKNTLSIVKGQVVHSLENKIK